MTIEERANQAAQWKATGIYNCAQAVTGICRSDSGGG